MSDDQTMEELKAENERLRYWIDGCRRKASMALGREVTTVAQIYHGIMALKSKLSEGR